MTPATRSAVAIRHIYYKDLGAFEELLRARGFRIRQLDPAAGEVGAELATCDLLIVLGGPLHRYEADQFPFLRKELALLEARLEAGRPTLGVGLGAELLARAMGARLHPTDAPSAGWAPIVLTEAGEGGPLRHIKGPVLHWRTEQCELPPEATCLAALTNGAPAAFSHGANAMALQFHVEVMAQRFERWLIGGAPELAAIPGVSVTRLRADTARFARALAAQGQQFLSDWLDQLRW